MLNEIFERKLRQHDIRSIIERLSITDRDGFLDALSNMLGRFTALLEVANRLSDSLSLDLLFTRLIEVTTEELDAERGTIFLNDKIRSELFARVALGDIAQEIRFPNHLGIAGAVFTTGEPIIIDDAYADSRFNPATDKKTGFRTRNILTAPIRSRLGEMVGVIQLLNKRQGCFTKADLSLIEAMASQAAAALQNARLYEQIERARSEEAQLYEVTKAISSELTLNKLLQKIMDFTTSILDADRSTLFLHDEKTNELWSVVAQGLESVAIRFPSHMGIAGSVFTTGETINIRDAYHDPRFNQEVDRKTGYLTRSILCAPVVNKEGKILGVTQVLNKKGGPFTEIDENRLKAFSAQASIAIENAKLFEEVLNMRNYNESILESLSNGVMSINEDRLIEKCNSASLHILNLQEDAVLGRTIEELFSGDRQWIANAVEKVMKTGTSDVSMDAELSLGNGRTTSVNLTVTPLINVKGEFIGCLLIFEDISSEKRLKGTLARYMTKEVADQLLSNADAMLGGQLKQATILFSDIRSFTTISERTGPQETVSLLNEYFTVMVDILFNHGGILDKYIGDALLAVFGAPFSTGRDADQALCAAIEMMRALREFNIRRTHEDKHPINIGIGINTDEVLVGNIGSMKRMDYTVIGDGVNLASRLESATKYYGVNIIISGYTRQILTDNYLLREIDLIRVKGKTKPVAIYEVLDFHDETTFPHAEEILCVFDEALTAYRCANWKDALKKFERTLNLHPGDKTAHLYVERCRCLLANPPPTPWDGVWVMAEK